MRKFMRTRNAAPVPPTPPPPPLMPLSKINGHAKTNGHSNGARLDDRSSLSASSRYWGGSAGSAAGAGSATGTDGAPATGGPVKLWEDPEFPPSARAVGDARLARGIVWKRPHELCARPTFRGEELGAAGEGPHHFAQRWSVNVGELGVAALCRAAAALALTPRLLARVAPAQPFRTHYTGAFRFRFWVFGSWRDVVVDDRLPVRAGHLLASRAALMDDFTLPLLEKAYAKLYGSYSSARVAGAAAALQELSGGVVQVFPLSRQPRPRTLHVLRAAAPRSTLLVAAAPALPPCCVTGLAQVRGTPLAPLVRLRSVARPTTLPRAPTYPPLSEADQDLLDQRALHPHEFWMGFEEFCISFTELQLVHVAPDDWLREPALHARRPWRAVLARRRWRAGHNAGGAPPAACADHNPQFHLQVPADCHVVVSLTQQYSPRAPRRLYAVGFALYALPSDAAPRRALAARPLRELRALDVAHASRAREVAAFFTLPQGQYLLVPHTKRPHIDHAFLLRVFTDQHVNIWEVNDDNIIIRNISSEFPDERQPLPPEMQATLKKLLGKEEIEEVDAEQVRRALRRGGRGCCGASRELCRALVALRDDAASGRMQARDLPPILQLLRFWRQCYARGGRGGGGARSSYSLRALLWAGGVHVSNKVLDACVARFVPDTRLTRDRYLLTVARIYLAHERYRCLDAKLKSNPLSLEEMILMTIYS